MSTTDNSEHKDVVARVVELCLNGGRFDEADPLFAPDYVIHLPNGMDLPPGVESFKLGFGAWREAFPDLHMSIVDLIGSDDLVANRYLLTGTHTGPLHGLAPTNRAIEVRGMDLHRVSDGRLSETWLPDDLPAILVQLGILTMPALQRRTPRPAG